MSSIACILEQYDGLTPDWEFTCHQAEATQESGENNNAVQQEVQDIPVVFDNNGTMPKSSLS